MLDIDNWTHVHCSTCTCLRMVMCASDSAFYVSAKTLDFGLLLKENVGPSHALNIF